MIVLTTALFFPVRQLIWVLYVRKKQKSQKSVSDNEKISLKKDEPQFLKRFRSKAFNSWKKMKSPLWAYLTIPEIDYDKVDKLRGMDITVSTTAKNNKEGELLLRAMKFPFKERG